jgi:Rrf2 family protein
MLSVTSEHALRSLVHLARLGPEKTMLGKDLAEISGVPAQYLAKILLTMRNAGLVAATRGSGGGYGLHRDPHKIFLIEVVELFEGVKTRPNCLLGTKDPCSDHDPCPAHQSWSQVRRSYIEFLEKTTLAEIAGLDRALSATGRSAGEPGPAGGR